MDGFGYANSKNKVELDYSFVLVLVETMADVI